MLTVDEVEALLLEHKEPDEDPEWPSWSWEEYQDSIPWREKSTTIEVVGLGSVKVWEHDFGGVETNRAHLLFQVGDRIFRKSGLWVSHDGMYWDGDFTEVKPVQKIVTDYEVI